MDYPEFFHIFKEFVESQKHYLVFYMDGSYEMADERPRYDDFNVFEYFSKIDILTRSLAIFLLLSRFLHLRVH